MGNAMQGPDFDGLTARQQETWASGDFHQIARQNVCMAEALCDAVALRGGERVLDVACGSGTAALVAARRYCEVSGIDYVPGLVERARERAAADRLDAEFRVADAQSLPYPDGRFDAVVSVYGVQFAPDQERAAREMLRVCAPGGRIGLATPVADGWSGDFFAAHARHVPPPAGTQPPSRWATESGLDALLGDGTRSSRSERRTSIQYYRSVPHAVDVFMTFFGPSIRVAAAGAADELRAELTDVFNRYNRATDGTAVIENTYCLTVAIRE